MHHSNTVREMKIGTNEHSKIIKRFNNKDIKIGSDPLGKLEQKTADNDDNWKREVTNSENSSN